MWAHRTRAGWRRSPAGPGRCAERPRGAWQTAFVRSVAHPGRLGWRRQQPGDKRLERRALAALASLPLAPVFSPSLRFSYCCFLFRQHFEGAEAPQGGRRVSGVLLPVSLVQRPVAGGGLAGTQDAHSLLAHTPDLFHPRRDILAPLLSRMHARKARTSLFRDSPGGPS